MFFLLICIGSLISREEQRSRVSKNRVLRIFGSMRVEVTCRWKKKNGIMSLIVLFIIYYKIDETIRMK
jgi:hypothetical protein